MNVEDVPKSALSPQTEALLDEAGVAWSVRRVALGEIDIKASMANQARITPEVLDRIERYRQALAQGAQFPCIITWDRNGSGHYVNADGNQRTVAHLRQGRAYIWAYVFRGDEDQFRVLADTANPRLNGLDNSLQERLMHASHHVDRGVQITVAATLFGVGKHQLNSYRTGEKQRIRFRELRVPQGMYSELSDNVISRFGLVADEVVIDALNAIGKGISATEVLKTLSEAAADNISDRQRAITQREALKELKERHAIVNAKSLVKPASKKKDTLYMRLHAAREAIARALLQNKPEYQPLLDDIRKLFR